MKGFPLDGDRHSVGEWLQYQFLTPGTKEEWTANSGNGPDSYFVQYQVSQESSRSGKTEPIVYIFQADLARKTVQGFNPAARELLSPQAPAHRTAPKAKKKPRKHRPLNPGEIPLLPLPSDSDLQRHNTASH